MKHGSMEKWKSIPTGNICDANNKGGNMDSGIKAVAPGMKLAGPAFTVNCPPGDNLTLHKAILEAKPGDVIVADVHAYCGAGHFGDIMAVACMEKGIAGLVIDGGCRDAADLQSSGFPVFCRGINPGGTVKETLGETAVSIHCGGQVVCPGDLIVADDDGVVVVKKENIDTVWEKAQAIADREIEVQKQLRDGKSTAKIYKFDKLCRD